LLILFCPNLGNTKIKSRDAINRVSPFYFRIAIDCVYFF
jgi:hypothetical protein